MMETPSRRSRILVADSEEAVATVQAVMGDAVDIAVANTMKEAERQLQEPLDMVICGIHFDGSNMFQLLHLVNSRHGNLPFVVFRDLASALDPTFAQSVQIAAKLLGALGLIDLYSLRQRLGTEEADRKFRGMVLDALHSGRLA
jgi:hypothetical protein